ncbi:MAG TPA: DUF4153 domain-containing protein [bacterium]|nr:DUF4153 domain-containing protein [bacterium]HQI47966.1 DUF4153 domain-containing protein [bacterium]HQJ65633.1 DUF4153 domain-containing protein [bacterium]
MKLPSLRQISQDIQSICLRFPLVLIDVLVGTIVALLLAEQEAPDRPTVLVNILMACTLGFPLVLGLAVAAEKHRWSMAWRGGSQAAGVVLVAAYGLSLPHFMEGAPALHIARFAMLAVALILFLAVGPFGGSREQNGFWHYCKILVVRAVTVLVFAGVLQAGFSLALLALDKLFGIEIPGRRYGELWILIVGLFSTSYFMAGIPEELDKLEEEKDYPRVLKIFAQYILSAVLLVYLVILYAYIAKIILNWAWPKGWVSALILGFSVTGLATLLLLWPVRAQEENLWGRLVWHRFFIVMIPVVIMLPLAVWRRVSEYGVTESRYLLILLALYLTLLVLYFNLSKVKNIKVIPGLLALFALFASFGPWSAFQISERSQKNRLEHLLAANSLLEAGQIHKATTTVPEGAALQISSIISYLREMHGYDSIQPWFKDKLVKESEGRTVRLAPSEVTGMLGFDYLSGVRGGMGRERTLSGRERNVIEIAGYDRMIAGQFIGEATIIEPEASGVRIEPAAGMQHLTLTLTAENQAPEQLRFNVQLLAEKLYARYGSTNPETIPESEMAIEASGAHFKARVRLRRILLEVKENGIKLVNYTADLLYAPLR